MIFKSKYRTLCCVLTPTLFFLCARTVSGDPVTLSTVSDFAPVSTFIKNGNPTALFTRADESGSHVVAIEADGVTNPMIETTLYSSHKAFYPAASSKLVNNTRWVCFSKISNGMSDLYLTSAAGGGNVWQTFAAPITDKNGRRFSPELVSANGASLNLFWIEDVGGSKLKTSRSSTPDTTWKQPKQLSETGTVGQLAATTYGSLGVLVVWTEQVAGGQSVIKFRRSGNDGIGWTDPVRNLTTGAIDVANPTIIANANGRIIVAFQYYVNGHWEIYTCTSQNEGTAWSQPVPASSLDGVNSIEPSLALSSTGKATLAWSDNSPANKLAYSESTDLGLTWSIPQYHYTSPSSIRFPRLVQKSSSQLSAVWLEQESNLWKILLDTIKDESSIINWKVY